MGSRIDYYFDIDRNANGFTLNADYHIDPAIDPRTGKLYPATDYSFNYADAHGTILGTSSGDAGATASVSDTFAFDRQPGVAVNQLQFDAENSHDSYGFYFYWNVYDAALETTPQSITGSNDTDIMFGGSANDTLRGARDDDWLDGGAGADTLIGGTGNDTYVVDNAADRVIEAANQGDDAVRASVTYSIAGSPNVETLDLTGTHNIGATGNDLANTLAGNSGKNVLVGGIGADHLFGEGGADVFRFLSLADSTVSSTGRDFIEDFSQAQGDHIDLRPIDANTQVAGNQAFTFIGKAAFTDTAGELRSVVSGATTTVLGDTNGDGKADFAITLEGRIALHAGDFFL